MKQDKKKDLNIGKLLTKDAAKLLISGAGLDWSEFITYVSDHELECYRYVLVLDYIDDFKRGN